MSRIIELAQHLNPSFAQAKILDLAETGIREQQDFIIEEEWQGQTSIDVEQIVGTRHLDYIGMTWLEFLHKGKRMALNHALFEQTPEYYLSGDKKLPTMSYLEVDGKLYIDDDGNHRSCIAKFYFSELGRNSLEGVEVRKVRIGRDDARSYLFLQETLLRHPHLVLTKERRHVSRDDGPGWKKDHYLTQVTIRNTKTGKQLTMKPNDLWEVLNLLDKPTWRQKLFPSTDLEQLLFKG